MAREPGREPVLLQGREQAAAPAVPRRRPDLRGRRRPLPHAHADRPQQAAHRREAAAPARSSATRRSTCRSTTSARSASSSPLTFDDYDDEHHARQPGRTARRLPAARRSPVLPRGAALPAVDRRCADDVDGRQEPPVRVRRVRGDVSLGVEQRGVDAAARSREAGSPRPADARGRDGEVRLAGHPLDVRRLADRREGEPRRRLCDRQRRDQGAEEGLTVPRRRLPRLRRSRTTATTRTSKATRSRPSSISSCTSRLQGGSAEGAARASRYSTTASRKCAACWRTSRRT